MTIEYIEFRRSVRSYILDFVLRTFLKPRFKSDTGDIEKLRRFVKNFLDDRGVLPDSTKMELRTTSSGQSVPIYQVSSKHIEDADRIILYLHGGGFFLETPHLHGSFLAQLIESISFLGTDSKGPNSKGPKFKGIMPRYRLAPEHPFPAAVDDVLSVYLGLLGEGMNPSKIVVAGDSAGGCLSLVLLQQLKARGLPMPACAVIISPGTDLSGVLQSHTDNVKRDPMFNQHALNYVNEIYLGGAQSLAKDPRVSPLRGDFHGLPPLLFMVGSTEVLLDDSVKATEKAVSAGVDARCDIWPFMPHCFALLPSHLLPEATLGLQDISKFIRTHI